MTENTEFAGTGAVPVSHDGDIAGLAKLIDTIAAIDTIPLSVAVQVEIPGAIPEHAYADDPVAGPSAGDGLVSGKSKPIEHIDYDLETRYSRDLRQRLGLFAAAEES
jgi:hypothetical protein